MAELHQPRLAALMRVEWRLLRVTPAVWIVVATSVAAIAAALAVGLDERDALRRAADEASAEQGALYANVRQRINQPVPASAVQAQLANFRAAIPPLAMAVVSVGRSDVLPQRYGYRPGAGDRFSPFERTVGTRALGGLFPERPMDNPSALVLGAFDLAFVVIYLYPLFIFALTHSIASADRDSGTLALVLAQPVSFRRWLLARIALRAGVLAIALIAAPVAFVLVDSRSAPAGDLVIRLVMWSAAVTAYCVPWLAVAASVNARRSSSALNGSILIGTWMVAVIIVPAVANIASRAQDDPASTFEFVAAEREASLEINPQIDAATATLGRSATPHRLRALTETRRELFEQRLALMLSRLDDQERRQRSMVAVLRMLSPAMLLESVLDELAGTSTTRWTDFLAQLDAYTRQREQFFTTRIMNAGSIGEADLDQLQPFIYRQERPVELLKRLAWPFAGLVLTAIVGVIFSVNAVTARSGLAAGTSERIRPPQA